MEDEISVKFDNNHENVWTHFKINKLMPFFSILHTTYLTSNTKTIFDIPSELLIG
jgi:hypothetical protein